MHRLHVRSSGCSGTSASAIRRRDCWRPPRPCRCPGCSGWGSCSCSRSAPRSASSSDGVGIFLILAPVLPVLGVAAAFAPRTDPLHEITAASPYSSFRLLVVRSLAVVAVTIALDSLAAVLLPGAAWVSVAWLLPTLALTAATLALSTAFDPVRAGLGMSAGWLLLTVPPLVLGKEPLLAVHSSAQFLSVAVIAGATIVLFARSNSAPVPLRRNS